MPGDVDLFEGVQQPDGHKVAGVQGPKGVGIACQCGDWQAFVTGAGSARFAGEDYRRHAREATRAQPVRNAVHDDPDEELPQ